jgi:DNA-binding NarL/FixJ family response regulator
VGEAILFSIVESATHPNFSPLYGRLGLREEKFAAMRGAISALKRHPPDIIVAEFFYGFANNYAGINISNLDVLLFSLQKYAPQAKVIVMASREEREHVERLQAIFPLSSVLLQPVTEAVMLETLQECCARQ